MRRTCLRPTRHAGTLAAVPASCFTASARLACVSLQRQLGKNIKFGQPPPSATSMKRADSGEASLEGDPLLASPMEPVTQQDRILPDAENKVRLRRARTRPLITQEAVGQWTGAANDPGVCRAGGRGRGFSVEWPRERTSWAGAFICSGTILGEEGGSGVSGAMPFARALPSVFHVILETQVWEAKLCCLLCAFAVRPQHFLHSRSPSVSTSA